MTDGEVNSLEMMIRHEEAIGQLYDLFSGLAPDHRDFWKKMAEDERRHADCFRDLSSKESIRMWFQTNSAFKRLAIQGSLDYIEAQKGRTLQGAIGLLEALSIARDLEDALIEKQFVGLNLGGPDEVKRVVRELVSETHRHRKAISANLDSQKDAKR